MAPDPPSTPTTDEVVASAAAAHTSTSASVVRTVAERPAARHLEAQQRAIAAKAAAVVELVGSKAGVARMLQVARTQPGQWLRGEEIPSGPAWERLSDLEYVLSRAALVFHPGLVMDWIQAPNAFLDGARPLDVLMLHGPSEVISALDAQYAGSYP